MPPQGRGLRASIAASIIALALFAASCRSSPDVARNASPNGAPELEALCRAQQDAWNRGDLEGFMALGYWNSPELAFLSGGEWTRGYAPMLERYRKRYASEGREMGALQFSEFESAHLDGEHGFVRGRWALAFADGSRVSGLFTLLMRRFPEGWRIVHDHTSVGA